MNQTRYHQPSIQSGSRTLVNLAGWPALHCQVPALLAASIITPRQGTHQSPQNVRRSQAAGSHRKCAKCGNSLQAFQAARNHELRRDFKTPKKNSTFLLLGSGSFHSKHSPTGWSHFMNVGLLGSVQSLATIFLRLKHTHTIWHTCSLSFAMKKSISQSGVTSCGSHTPLGRAALFYGCWHSSLEPETFSLVQVWRWAYYIWCFDEVLLYLQGFLSDSDGKESTSKCRRPRFNP